jgi:hypothetical protein
MADLDSTACSPSPQIDTTETLRIANEAARSCVRFCFDFRPSVDIPAAANAPAGRPERFSAGLLTSAAGARSPSATSSAA